MKIVTGMLVVVILFLGFFFLQNKITSGTHPALFLPGDTIAYVEQKNSLAALQFYKNSRLGKAIASINLIKILEQIDIPPAQRKDVENTLQNLHEFEENRLVQELLGNQFSLALIGDRSWTDKDPLPLKLKKQLVLISKPLHNAKILDIITSHYSGEAKVTTIPYGSHSIKRFELPSENFTVAVVDGFVIASYEERTLRECLDSYDKKGQSLAASTNFKRNMESLLGAERFAFISLDQVRSFARKQLEHSNIPEKNQLIQEITDTEGTTELGYGVWRNQANVVDKMIVFTRKEQANPYLQKILAIAPEKNDSLNLVSENMLMYYWTNTFDLSTFWKMVLSESQKNPQSSNAFKAAVKDATGNSVEEILAMLGTGISFFVEKGSENQLMPLPDIALIIKLQKEQEFGVVLEKILTKYGFAMTLDTYNSIPYHYWGTYPTKSLQPLYAIHNNKLYITNNVDMLKKVTDGPLQDASLLNSTQLADFNPGFDKPSNTIYYSNQVKLLDSLQDLISWGGTMIALKDRNLAVKSKILIDQLINPIFDGLSMYEKSATRSYTDKDLIIVESKTKIAQ